VKEADALASAGHDVHVVASYFMDWATDADRHLVAARRWTLSFIDWRRSTSPALFHRSRLRHFAARAAAVQAPRVSSLAIAALSRVGPELRRATMGVGADLYVAHNLAALPIVAEVAAAKGALAAFDAEDFHSGQMVEQDDPKAVAFVRAVEARWLPSCAYITAAAPAIAEAYRDLYGIPLPTTILNVFPLSDRPAAPRPLVSEDPLRLYWFSQTIGPDRGLEDAIDAMGLLREAAIELHVRGTWQAGYEETLRGRASAHGLGPSCITHHAAGAPEEMVRLAAAYDVGLALEPGVTLNNSILLSNKIFTYLLAGIGVLATRTRGQAGLSPEIDGATAWGEPASPASLAAALKPWIANRDALRAARAEAWRLGGERFNWDIEQRRYLDLVETISSTKASSRAMEAKTVCAK
jgi:glycosyltransferase involved in cell wall biosynthesis